MDDKIDQLDEKDSAEVLFSKESNLEKRLQEYDELRGRRGLSAEPHDSSLASTADSPLDQVIYAIDSEIEETYGQVVTADFGTSKKETVKGQEQYIVFSLSSAKYAVPITNVIEIGRFMNITPVPNLPVWLRGVTNIRGDIISVIDLGLFLGIERTSQLDSSLILVVRIDKDEVSTALVVDQVNQILNLSKDQVVAPTAPIEDKIAPFLRGVYEQEGQLLLVLDLEKFLRSSELRQFE